MRRFVIYKAYKHIDEVSGRWDGFLPPDHHLQAFHLRTLEKSKIDHVTFFYLVFENETGEIIGVAYFQWLFFTKEHYAFPFSKNLILKWVEERIMRKGFRILVCGNLLRINSPGLFFHPAKVTAPEIFSLLEEFYKTLQPYPHAILIKDWPDENNVTWVRQFNFEKWQQDLTMKLPLKEEWKTIDDYVKSLRHRYSQRYRKMRRMLYPVNSHELTSQEVSFYAGQIEDLYLNVVQRQSIRLLIVNGNYFTEMKKAMGNRFRIVGYFNAEELVAFSSNIIHDEYWELHYIGLNYSHNKTHALYFNILYDAIGNSLKEGSPALELGRTAINTKEIVGASPIYFYNYVRIKGNIAARITRYLKEYFNDKSEMGSLGSKPFKTDIGEKQLIPKL